jgi:hypothetical protein
VTVNDRREKPRRRSVLRVLARWVKGWAESVLEEEAPRVPPPPVAPPMAGNGSPPEHWLQLVQSARRGPPADWVERVRQGAPHLLEKLEVPRASVQTPAPSPGRSPESVRPTREPPRPPPMSPAVEQAPPAVTRTRAAPVPRVHFRPRASRGPTPAPRERGPVPAPPSPEETPPLAAPLQATAPRGAPASIPSSASPPRRRAVP